MIQKVIDAIDQVVEEIYTAEQARLQVYYIAFMDAFSAFLDDMAKMGYTVDMTEDLQKMQQALTIKDYILLSDILLYEVRPDFVNLLE